MISRHLGPGTLGGFLKDQSGQIFGVTCGHVGQQVGNSVTLEDLHNVRYVSAGIVKNSSFSSLTPTPQSTVCNQYLDNLHTDVDVALIELNSGFVGLNSIKKIGVVDEIYDRYQLQSGSQIWMQGAASGPNSYLIGGYGVTIKVVLQVAGKSSHYCFSHVFEIYHPGPPRTGVRTLVPALISQAMTNRPLPGNSGAWICFKKAQNYAYFGNLIAVQGANGIATFADSLVNWADTACSLKLGVL